MAGKDVNDRKVAAYGETLLLGRNRRFRDIISRRRTGVARETGLSAEGMREKADEERRKMMEIFPIAARMGRRPWKTDTGRFDELKTV